MGLTTREEAVMSQLILDRPGRRRSPATLPGFHIGQAPGNKGHRYPADPPKVEEIVAVMRAAGDRPHGQRMRALIVILWRAGLRIHEALGLTEGDLDESRGALLVRRARAADGVKSACTPGRGSSCNPGSSCDVSSRSARCCASSPIQPVGATGHRLPLARSFDESPPRLACVVGLPRISSATLTRSRWLAKACRSS
jgi:hypothetical protein